ncbi:MAG: class I SAM-dependent methyltransferase [Flavobacteriaceae bacterium]|nr:class I SAM-dependent methyltransferase [Flavobacteriaceae bacterium]
MINYIKYGFRWLNHSKTQEGISKTKLEIEKSPKRHEIINFLLSQFNNATTYLEIGVRNPDHNFNKIDANKKYSVDPGVEFKSNPVDFQLTSDAFFEQLEAQKILTSDTLFDVIFIDGLHLAEQVDRDISNALKFIKSDGFVVLHDCNPPTEWHAREDYYFNMTPAKGHWNGTTWKAFVKWRSNPEVQSCCVDTDWGIGILSKSAAIGSSIPISNDFFEYNTFANDRKYYLNLVDFEELKGFVALK